MDPKERRKICKDFWLNSKPVNPENKYKPRNGDIIAVGPPKSGTTWLQQILHQIRTKGDETLSDIYDVTWYIPNPGRQWSDFNLNAEQKFNPRVFKHHEPYGVIETTDKQKVIVIIRDLYDAVYSMKKFFSGYYGDDEDISEEESINLLTEMDEKSVGTTFQIISTWWEHRNDDGVLFLFYEDLKLDLEAMIRKISEFVEIPLTEDEIRRVCHLCSFEYMTEHKEKFQGDAIITAITQCTGIENWTPKIGMIRTDGGEIGQGLNNLETNVKDMVDKLWKDTIEPKHGFKSYQDMYNKHGYFAKRMKRV